MTSSGSDWRREQLRRTLEHWRANNSDPHVVLGIPPGASPYQIIDAHRRWVAAYHPDRHNNDPIATELTRILNSARDTLLAPYLRQEQLRREQERRQEEARRQSATAAWQQREDQERIRRQRRQENRTSWEDDQRNQYQQAQQTRRHARPVNYRPQPQESPSSKFPWRLVFAVIAIAFVGFCVFIQNRNEQSFAPASTSAPTRVPTATETPSGLTNAELARHRTYALSLINDARAEAGLNPVELDDNPAAQAHAEDMLETCFSSHWGSDGLKPYMRYSLAGGRQHSAENISGSDYCPTNPDRYRVNSVRTEIYESMEGLLESPGHRENILNPHHRRVNIGIAYKHPNFWFVQLFVGDYIEFETEPTIHLRILTLSGTVTGDVNIKGKDRLGVQIYFDSPTNRLTRGQLARTYCYGSGTQVAALRPTLDPGWFYDDDIASKSVDHAPCPNPYDVDSNLPPPDSDEQANQLWQQAYDASQVATTRTVSYPWITSKTWVVDGQSFVVSVDVSDVLAQHGDGVYTVVVWGEINGEDVPISEYSIFVPPLRHTQAEVFAYITPTPHPAPTNTPNPEPHATPTVVPTRNLTPEPTAIPTQFPTSEPAIPTDEISNAQEYVLSRINEVRITEGLNAFVLDINTAAQSHAEDMRENCFHSHWGSDGLKSYMRYSLAGGQQYSSVYISGSDYCPPDPKRYRHRTIQDELSDLMDRLLANPDYLDVILNPNYSRVSFGVADQQPNFWFVQRFITDFITYAELPTINSQILRLSGRVKNGPMLSDDAFGISINYDPSPYPLTRGQLHHTSCGASGVRIGALREPIETNRYYTSDTFTLSGTRCQDPYYVPADAPVATSYDDDVPSIRNPYENEAVWITATHWEVTDETFSVTADVGELLNQHGNGVYTILIWGEINGERTPISEYSIFIPPYSPAP